uniref:Uncharacterized protein n=1 Tax=Timema bartmani TaxID=61472 RepID=A0A7R9I407_9NEOP|nr:unnamed protein product [Timema bartmani]
MFPDRGIPHNVRTDDKIKRVDSIKVTFVNPFHHSELDKWISQCYRNNDLKCIVQGISKYSQLYTLRDVVIEKDPINRGGFSFVFQVNTGRDFPVFYRRSISIYLELNATNTTRRMPTARPCFGSGAPRHARAVRFGQTHLANGTSLGVDFSNTLMELCEKDDWERHTLNKLWLKLGQMIANEADNISTSALFSHRRLRTTSIERLYGGRETHLIAQSASFSKFYRPPHGEREPDYIALRGFILV